MTADVLKEAPRRLALGHDAGHRRPQVPVVGCSALLSGDGEGLAGVAPNDAIHEASKFSGVELAEVSKDWGQIQTAISHSGLENFLTEGVFFNIGDDSGSRCSQFETQIETTHTRTQ